MGSTINFIFKTLDAKIPLLHIELEVRASSVALGKAHCKPKPILLKIAQNLEGVHQILLKNGKILPHPPTLPLKFKILEGVWGDVGESFHF
jgi:hypothetical protein